jgi:hypothetical protein
MFHIFHDWKITKRGLAGEEFDGAIRLCKKCGKRQRLNIHILGHNPYNFVETWVDIKPKKPNK